MQGAFARLLSYLLLSCSIPSIRSKRPVASASR